MSGTSCAANSLMAMNRVVRSGRFIRLVLRNPVKMCCTYGVPAVQACYTGDLAIGLTSLQSGFPALCL